MSATTTTIELGAKRSTREASAGERRFPRWRHLWLVPGIAIAIYANQIGNSNGVGILALIGFGIMPDVPRLFGARGRGIHGLLHQELPALIAVAIAATGVVPVIFLVGALTWLGHVITGRGVGDVPKRGGAVRNA